MRVIKILDMPAAERPLNFPRIALEVDMIILRHPGDRFEIVKSRRTKGTRFRQAVSRQTLAKHIMANVIPK